MLAHVGIGKVYSFHMTLSWSRDPFCCFVTSTDPGTFFDCHRRAFAHFGGVPGVLVYDRTKTVVKRHVAPGAAVPLHPEAAAFADHYGFAIDVLAAYRATGKGRVERQVDIVREHVLVGRGFDSLGELDAAFTGWVPIRRGQTHRTHGEVIGQRAKLDHAALGPLLYQCLTCRCRSTGTSPERRTRHPGGDDFGRLHEWAFTPDGESFRSSGPTGRMLDEINASGAVLVGRRTAEQVDHWGGDHHGTGIPIFVPSHRPPARRSRTIR